MNHKKIHILFLRSYSKAPFSANIARALALCPKIRYTQYPPWPEDRRGRVEKLYQAENAWKALHENVIEDPDELRKKLLDADFDLILLADHDAQLFEFQNFSRLQKAKRRAQELRKMLRDSVPAARAHADYARSLPFSLPELNRQIPVVTIDWSDTAFLTGLNQKLLRESALYFKRELPFDRLFLFYHDRPAPWSFHRQELLPVLDKVHGIPLGIEDGKYYDLKSRRVSEQDIDVFFAGSITNTQRKTGLERLKKIVSETSWNIVIEDSLSFEEYCAMMARSKITISIAGGGWDCFRHYEAVALGSLPLMNKPTVDAIWWHSMPEDIFFENSFANFTTRIEELLQNVPLRQGCLDILEQQVEDHMLHSKIIAYIVQTSLKELSIRHS